MNKKAVFDKLPKQIKASAVNFIASFINGAMNFITIPIFTRLMTTEEYGLIAQYNAWLNIIMVFATLSLSAGVYQVAMNDYSDDRDGFTFSALILSNICTCFVFSIILAFSNYFSLLFRLDKHLLMLMFLYLLFSPAMSMWLARQRYEYKYNKVAVVSIISAVLSQIIALASVVLIQDENLGMVKLFATQIVMIICSLAIYISIARNAKWKIHASYIRFALLFNLPLLLHYLAQYVLQSTDKIMITNFWGEASTGVYSLATTVANIAMLVWAAMSASLTPYVYSHINTKEYGKIRKVIKLVAIFFAVGCVLVAFIGPEVMYVLGSKKYISGKYLIPPIAATSLLAAIYSFYSSIAFYYHKTIFVPMMTIIAALINVILNYLFIPAYGYVAAAYTTETAYLIYTFLHFLNYRKIVGKEKIYDDNFIWSITLGTTLLCLSAGFLYECYIIRYIIVFCIIIVCGFYGKHKIPLFEAFISK